MNWVGHCWTITGGLRKQWKAEVSKTERPASEIKLSRIYHEQLQPRIFESRRTAFFLLPILANKRLGPMVPHQFACQRLAKFVAMVYDALERNDTDALPKVDQKMALRYFQLEKEALKNDPEDNKTWHVIPKLHVVLQLCGTWT